MWLRADATPIVPGTRHARGTWTKVRPMNQPYAELEALERALHEVLTIEDLAGAPLAHLDAALGVSQSLLFSYGPRREPNMVAGRLRDRALAEYTPDYFAADPLHPYMRAQAPRFLQAPDEDLHAMVARTPVYANFYGPAEADYYLGVWPTPHPYGAPGMFGVFLARSRRAGPFDARALRAFARLAPSFQAMARRVERVVALERERAALAAWTELSATPRVAALVWDLDGRVLAGIDPTTRWLAATGVGVADLWRVARQLYQDWRRRTGGSSRWERTVRGPDADVRASFAVRTNGLAAPLLVAVLERAPHALARTATLTPAERRVLAQLAHGRRNADIADALGVSLDTVKTHVKQIFAKLQVGSRSEAALLGAALGAGAGAGDALFSRSHPFG